MANITADQVQNAYALNLGGVGFALQNAQQQYAYQQQLAQHRRKEQQAQQLQALNVVEDATKGLDAGTGSPMDDYFTQQIAAARQGAIKFAASNPDPLAQYAYAQNAVKGIRAEQDNAKKLVANIGAYTKLANKDTPNLYDETALQNGFLNNAFYTTDAAGNRALVSKVDPNVNFVGDILTNPQSGMPYLNRSGIDLVTPERISKLYPAVDQSVNAFEGKIPVVRSAKIPAYAAIDPATGNTRINYQPLTIPDTQGDVQGAPAEIVSTMMSDPYLSRQLLFGYAEAKKQYPKADESQLQQIAAAGVLQRHGVGRGDLQAQTKVDETYKQQRQEQKDARSLAMENERLSLSKQGLSLRQQTAAQKKAATASLDNTTPNSILTQWESGTLKDNPEGLALWNSQAVTVPMPGGGAQIGYQVNGVDGQPFLKDPADNQPMKMYAFIDEEGKPAYATTTYRTTTAEEKKKGKGAIVPTGSKIYKGSDRKQLRISLSPQLEPSKQEQKKFNNTLNLATELD